jgi:hypothetical protein
VKNVFFHTALKILDKDFSDHHITTMFSEFIGKGEFSTSTQEGTAKITDIVFWKEACVVVALIDCDLAVERYNFFTSLGFHYDHQYKPHITLEYSKIDNSDSYKYLINKNILVGQEYFKPIYKK